MVVAFALALLACAGPDDPGSATASVTVPAGLDGIGAVGLRRLSRDELDRALLDLVGDDTRPATTHLPEDVVDPFDNDVAWQDPSGVLVQGLEAMANATAARLVADPDRRSAVVGCEPAGPEDAACLEQVVRTLSRRALRRPPEEVLVAELVALGTAFAQDSGDFYEGVDVVLRVLLQHPAFVYRPERGTPTDQADVVRLDDWEVATRLAFFLWGSSPDDALLDLAEAEQLSTSAQVAAAAERLLADPRARERVDRFHAMWLGWYKLPHSQELTDALRTETRLFLDHHLFDAPVPWLDLFTASGTFLDPWLAEHYGLPAPPGEGWAWVDYPADSERTGLLSHGAFLSVGAKFDDTSPTQRGKLIRTRLFCQAVAPPPPDVNVDEPPVSEDSDCKWDRYEAHRAVGSCASCHEALDPVGFGLERFDREGRHRTHDDGLPDCHITGEGTLDGQSFEGPGGLAGLLVDGAVLDACLVTQVYTFAMGHDPTDLDMPYVTRLAEAFRAQDHDFQGLLLALVEDEAFLYRREEP